MVHGIKNCLCSMKHEEALEAMDNKDKATKSVQYKVCIHS